MNGASISVAYRRPISLSPKRQGSEACMVVMTIDKLPATAEQLAAAQSRGRRRGKMLALVVGLRKLGGAAKAAGVAFTQLASHLPREELEADGDDG